jgi:hypothetical protein
MLRTFINCAMVLKKRLNFFYFQWEKVDQVRSEYRILLKPRRDDSFNKDLSNEPNFGRIHLAGQYL